VVLPRLQAIVDIPTAERAGVRPFDLARAFLEGGARLIQIRAKALPSGPFLELCDAIVGLARPYQAAVIVNDRVDLARLSGSAGVHVGQDDLPAGAARAILGPNAIVGFSTHTVDQVESAVEQPVTYVAVGPVFGSRTKDTGYQPVGLDLVRAAVARAGRLPVVAIGGITLDTARQVIDAGASCVAVISDLTATGDPAVRVRQYVDCLGTEGRPAPPPLPP
jgi:thiamine-phosphate pyrophosphorylase